MKDVEITLKYKDYVEKSSNVYADLMDKFTEDDSEEKDSEVLGVLSTTMLITIASIGKELFKEVFDAKE